MKDTKTKIQEFECVVKDYNEDGVFCILRDLTNKDNPDEFCEFHPDQLRVKGIEFDKDDYVFYWQIGFITKESGFIKNYSSFIKSKDYLEEYFGPQKQPSSINKIEAEVKYLRKKLI